MPRTTNGRGSQTPVQPSEMDRRRKRRRRRKENEPEAGSGSNSSSSDSDSYSSSFSELSSDSETNSGRQLYEIQIRRYVRERRSKLPFRFNRDNRKFLRMQESLPLVALFIELGLLDASKLEKDFRHLRRLFDRPGVFYSENGNNRITELTLCYRTPSWESISWDLPAERHFELLEKFEALHSLRFDFSSCVCLGEIISRLPNITYIHLHECERIDFRSEQLLSCTNSWSNLEKLILSEYCMESEEDFASFLFEILPFCPRLSYFDVETNKIRSFQTIAKRLETNPPKSRLRIVNLGWFTGKPYWLVRLSMDEKLSLTRPISRPKGWEKDVAKERKAVQTFLHSYPELQTLVREKCNNPKRASKGIAAQLYQMEINHAGRILVESGNMESLPSSIWPRVLARAWEWKEPKEKEKRQNTSALSRRKASKTQKKHFACNGIYYLLQNVGVLRAMSQRKPVARKVFYNDEWHYTYDLPSRKSITFPKAN